MIDNNLILAATQQRVNSYALYSFIKIGAAIKLDDNRIVTGANIEFEDSKLNISALESAIYNLINKGYRAHNIVAIAISSDTKELYNLNTKEIDILNNLNIHNIPLYISNMSDKIVKIIL